MKVINEATKLVTEWAGAFILGATFLVGMLVGAAIVWVF